MVPSSADFTLVNVSAAATASVAWEAYSKPEGGGTLSDSVVFGDFPTPVLTPLGPGLVFLLLSSMKIVFSFGRSAFALPLRHST